MPSLVRPDGCRLNYEIYGDGEPLILLEGMGGDIRGWRRNIPRLSEHLQVIGYDFRGNGGSDEPTGPCSMSTFVQDTAALLDHLGIERVHVYGQSFGGMIAQELALARPERVRTLILACTHCGGSHVVRPRGAEAPVDRPWLALYSPEFAREHPDHVSQDLRIGSLQPKHPLGRKRQWEAMQSFNTFDRLGSIDAPTLVLQGTRDLLVDPANAEILAARIPGAELAWMEGAGHVYHSEQPEAADEAVIDFIGRHADP